MIFWSRIILKTLHTFGLCKRYYYIPSVTVNIKLSDRKDCGCLKYSICRHLANDINKEVFKYLESNRKFKKNCKRSGIIHVKYIHPDKMMDMFEIQYYDDKLYWMEFDEKEYARILNLNSLLEKL